MLLKLHTLSANIGLFLLPYLKCYKIPWRAPRKTRSKEMRKMYFMVVRAMKDALPLPIGQSKSRKTTHEQSISRDSLLSIKSFPIEESKMKTMFYLFIF